MIIVKNFLINHADWRGIKIDRDRMILYLDTNTIEIPLPCELDEKEIEALLIHIATFLNAHGYVNLNREIELLKKQKREKKKSKK